MQMGADDLEVDILDDAGLCFDDEMKQKFKRAVTALKSSEGRSLEPIADTSDHPKQRSAKERLKAALKERLEDALSD